MALAARVPGRRDFAEKIIREKLSPAERESGPPIEQLGRVLINRDL